MHHFFASLFTASFPLKDGVCYCAIIVMSPMNLSTLICLMKLTFLFLSVSLSYHHKLLFLWHCRIAQLSSIWNQSNLLVLACNYYNLCLKNIDVFMTLNTQNQLMDIRGKTSKKSMYGPLWPTIIIQYLMSIHIFPNKLMKGSFVQSISMPAYLDPFQIYSTNYLWLSAPNLLQVLICF